MERKRKISSLKDLRREREMLKLEMEVTKSAIGRSVDNVVNDTQDFVVKKILLPFGLSTLATYILKHWVDGNASNDNGQANISSALPGILVTAAQFIIDHYQNQEDGSVETESRPREHSAV